MHHDDRTLISDRYAARLREHGATPEALATGSPSRRMQRFRVLREVGIESGASVLDIGCGLGDFRSYLTQHGAEVDYVGYDLVPAMVREARKHHPDVEFQVRDVREDGIDGRFDFVVASQVFNNRFVHGDNLAEVEAVLALAHEAAEQAVAMDFISSYVDYREDHLFYYEPEIVFGMAKDLTKRVTLRHDYPLFEFAVYLYPDFRGWGSDAGRAGA